MNATWISLLAVVLVGCWLAIYRLPFGDESRRSRIALRLSDVTSLRAATAFALFATLLYLCLGMVVFFVMALASNNAVATDIRPGSPSFVWITLLAILGCSSLNAFCISALYKVHPSIDVPGEVSSIQWIASILSLPKSFRWAVPATAALVEELVFRDAIFVGLLHSGMSFVPACSITTLLFIAGQVALVSTKVQGLVMGLSSLNLSVVGCLLVISTGSIIPALILHMSFAGFYTNMSVKNPTARAQRWSL